MNFVARLYSNTSLKDPSYKDPFNWQLLGFMFLTICIFILEFVQPFYFTQDDNLVQFFPLMLDFCRQLEHGEISTYDPYSMMGIPALSTGVYSLTYPFTFVSYLFSKYILQNEYFTIEVFAVLHLIGGYFVTVKTLKILKVRNSIAVIGGLCFVLSGYSLLAGRSWYYMLPQLLWTPALVYCIINLFQQINLKWIIVTGLVIGISFHAGNAQMWIYGLMFAVLAIVIALFTKNISWKQLLAFFSSLFIGIAIAFPLLILQFSLTKNMPSNVWGNGISSGIISIIFPYPIVERYHPNGWGNKFIELQGQFYYSGTLFSAIGIISILVFAISFLIIKKHDYKEFIFSNVWMICGITAFILALGNEGILWKVLYQFPPFNKFTNPFKFLHFVNLFFILGGALVLERFFSSIKSFQKILENGMIIIVGILLIYHVTLAKSSFYSYGFIPYPELPEKIKNITKDHQRILSLTPDRSPDKNYSYSLPHNIAGVYGLTSFNGYDNIIDWYQFEVSHVNRKINDSILLDYGIQYIFQFKEPIPENIKKPLELYYRWKGITVYKIKNVLPLAFEKSDSTKALPLSYTSKGFVVNTSSVKVPSEIVLNYCYYPEFIATADGNQLNIAKDEKGRILIKIPNQISKLEINYSPNFSIGLILGLVFLILAAAFYFTYLKINKSNS